MPNRALADGLVGRARSSGAGAARLHHRAGGTAPPSFGCIGSFGRPPVGAVSGPGWPLHVVTVEHARRAAPICPPLRPWSVTGGGGEWQAGQVTLKGWRR